MVSGAEITALIASAVAVGTLAREWARDRFATSVDARSDAATWYKRWHDAEQTLIKLRKEFEDREAQFLARMMEREVRWEEKCRELESMLAVLRMQVEELKSS